jgi:hypothetical protein
MNKAARSDPSGPQITTDGLGPLASCFGQFVLQPIPMLNVRCLDPIKFRQ